MERHYGMNPVNACVITEACALTLTSVNETKQFIIVTSVNKANKEEVASKYSYINISKLLHTWFTFSRIVSLTSRRHSRSIMELAGIKA